jgi:hypothetical protein
VTRAGHRRVGPTKARHRPIDHGLGWVGASTPLQPTWIWEGKKFGTDHPYGNTVRIVQLTSGPRCMHMQDLISHGPHVSHSSAPCFRRDGPHRIFFLWECMCVAHTGSGRSPDQHAIVVVVKVHEEQTCHPAVHVLPPSKKKKSLW